MGELERVVEADVATYRRGLRWPTIVRGALTRFLPGSIASSLGLFAFLNAGTPAAWIETAGVAFAAAAALTVGFGAALTMLKQRLYPDADVGGRRSLLAGLLAPLAIFMVMGVVGGVDLASLPWVFGAGGLAAALAIFFPWLTPTPESMLAERYLPSSQDEDEGAWGGAS